MDFVIAGWPCHDHSRAGAGQGLEDPKSSLFWDLIRLMQWWFVHQPFPLRYISEIVPLLGDFRDKVLEGHHYVCQHLGYIHFCGCREPWFLCPPASVDLDQHHTVIHFSSNIFWSASTIWSEGGWHLGSKPDLFAGCSRCFTPLVLVNKVGVPRRVFSTFMTFSQSFTFHDRGSSIV